MKAIQQILEEEHKTGSLNAMRLTSAYDIRTQYLVNSNGDLFLAVDLLIRLNHIITGSKNTGLRTYNVRVAGINKRYMTVDKTEATLYGLVDDFNDRRITHRQFVEIFLDQIHPFADGNGRTCKILFANKFV